MTLRGPPFPVMPEFGILSSPSLSTCPCLILSRPMTSSSSEAMSPTPLGLLVARPQRSQGRGQGSHEGHYLLQRRRKNQRHLIRPKIRRIPSLVKNVAGKMAGPVSKGTHQGDQCWECGRPGLCRGGGGKGGDQSFHLAF